MIHLINAALKYEGMPSGSIPEGDGIECLTDFRRFAITDGRVMSAHLPYCIDWYGVWSGKREGIRHFGDREQRYITYGRSREEIVDNLSDAIAAASEMCPAYAVLHAGSANFDELFAKEYSETSEEVLLAFCEMMNRVYHRIGRMPVRLMFENQWWPGLRFIDGHEYGILEDNLEFHDWGYCLDTGHLLVASKRASDERSNISLLKGMIARIPDHVRERIEVMHLHNNSSGAYMRGFDGQACESIEDIQEKVSAGYGYAVGMDEHRPFAIPDCTGIVGAVSPSYLVHEMGATDIGEKVADYMIQRGHFVEDAGKPRQSYLIPDTRPMPSDRAKVTYSGIVTSQASSDASLRC